MSKTIKNNHVTKADEHIIFIRKKEKVSTHWCGSICQHLFLIYTFTVIIQLKTQIINGQLFISVFNN